MKDIKPEFRPREKALQLGIEVLNDEELLCLILGSGTPVSSVCSMAREILTATDQLSRLAEMDMSELTQIEGIGKARALGLMASVELAKRALKAKAILGQETSQDTLILWLQAEYGNAPQEYFIGIYLNPRGRVVSHKVLFKGTLDCSLIHPRDLFREAFRCNASSVLFVHNHPSQDITPSIADLHTTRNLMEAAEISGIRIQDHLIISGTEVFSFRQHHLLEKQKKMDPFDSDLSDLTDWSRLHMVDPLYSNAQKPADRADIPASQKSERLPERKEKEWNRYGQNEV